MLAALMVNQQSSPFPTSLRAHSLDNVPWDAKAGANGHDHPLWWDKSSFGDALWECLGQLIGQIRQVCGACHCQVPARHPKVPEGSESDRVCVRLDTWQTPESVTLVYVVVL